MKRARRNSQWPGVGSRVAAMERTTSTCPRIKGSSSATPSRPRSMQPARRVSAFSAASLFLWLDSGPRIPARTVTPRPCESLGGAVGRPDHRSKSPSPQCNNQAQPHSPMTASQECSCSSQPPRGAQRVGPQKGWRLSLCEVPQPAEPPIDLSRSPVGYCQMLCSGKADQATISV